jgi:UDPglucose--hexose-1-phosphate uridylyltransferase
LPFLSHEIIIETPEHGKSLAWLNTKQVEQVLLAYRDRYLSLSQDTRLKYILIFRNHGKVAGALLDQAHSQLIATPIIPQQAWLKIKGIERKPAR